MKKLFKSGGLIVLLLLLSSTLFAQSNRELILGDIRVNPGEGIDAMGLEWPKTWDTIDSGDDDDDMSSVNGVNIGTRITWTDESNVSWDYKIAQGISSKFTDIEEVISPVLGKFKRTFKYSPPVRMIDGTNWTSGLNLKDPYSESIPSDAQVYGEYNTWTGIDIKRWTYAFANHNYDDMVIYEWVFTNNSGELRPDTYFSIVTELLTGDHYPGNLWSDYYGAQYATGQDSLRMYYMWDADELVDEGKDDKADPDIIWGNFEKPQFMGMLVLHADKSTSDTSDDPAQPHKAGWSQRELMPSLSEATHDEIYEFMSGPWNAANPDLVTFNDQGMYRILDPTWEDHIANPVNEQAKPGSMHFGPYQMQPGDDVRIVVAYVGGTISERLAIDAGRAYDSGYESWKGTEMPYDVMGLGVEGKYLTQAQKDLIIDSGKDSLFATAGKAVRAWENGSVNMGTGSFAVPAAPPSPSLNLNSRPDKISIEWGTEAEGFANLKGYNIYRSYYRNPALEVPTDTSFVLLASVGAGTTSFDDTQVVRGRNYWYYVTSVTNDGVESSMLLNRSGQLKTGDSRLEEAVTMNRPAAADWKDKIVVVPNPYHARGVTRISKFDQLQFFNTPEFCNIHIYTMTGDKVQTLEHTNGSGDEGWLRQDTFSSMDIVSGIYIFVVEELDGPNGSATGETAIGKFVVVK